MTFYFPKMMSDNSLPAAGRRTKGNIRFVYRNPVDGFSSAFLTQAST